MVNSQLDDVTTAVQALVQTLDRERRPNVILQRGCEQAIQAVPEAEMASITLLDKSRKPTTAACTHLDVFDLNAIQYDSGEGPCIDAAARQAMVRVATASARQQWPKYAVAAEAAGIGSHLSVPLYIGSQHVGAFNLYSANGHGFSDLDVALLELYTSALQGILQVTTKAAEAHQLAEQLGQALETRGPIDQAKGILMARHRINADEAFALLSRQSQDSNTKIRDLAQNIIEEVTT